MRNSAVGFLVVALVLSLAVGAAFCQEPSHATPAQESRGPRVFQLVLFGLGSAWVKEKPPMQQAGIQDHGAYMTKLIKEGTLVIGGPLLEDPTGMKVNGAMMILATDSPEKARQILEKDPAHISGLLEITTIRPLMVTGASWRPPQSPK